MPAIEVKPGIYWIGVNDRTTDLFEGLWPITQEGVSYNAYLVVDEKVALVDLAKTSHAGALLSQIADVVDPARLDYVVLNHMEPDHTGAINLLLQVAPKITFLCSAKAVPMLKAFYQIPDACIRAVGEGEEVSLGATTLRFAMIPFVHWPETMVTYAVEQRVAFTCDAFGGFGALRGAILTATIPTCPSTRPRRCATLPTSWPATRRRCCAPSTAWRRCRSTSSPRRTGCSGGRTPAASWSSTAPGRSTPPAAGCPG